jgi:subtilisin family serine protease
MSLLPKIYMDASGQDKTPASGTSMAAPAVSKLAARCLQIHPQLQAAEVKRILMETAAKKISLQDKILSGGEVHSLNALKACELAKNLPLEKAIELAQSLVAQPLENPPKATLPEPPQG